MRYAPDQAARNALWRLAARRPDSPPAEPLLFLRTPAIAVLWIAAVCLTVALLALGKMRVPRLARGVAVATQTTDDSLTLLLLLPPATAGHIAPGQVALVDTGGGTLVPLTVTSVERDLLDGTSARPRFQHPANVLGHLDGPKVVAHLACGPGRCLTLEPGTSYPATATLGVRTLASFALSGT